MGYSDGGGGNCATAPRGIDATAFLDPAELHNYRPMSNLTFASKNSSTQTSG